MTYVSDELKEEMGFILVQNPSRRTYDWLVEEAKAQNKSLKTVLTGQPAYMVKAKWMKVNHAYWGEMSCITEGMVEDVESSVRELMGDFEDSLADFDWEELSLGQQMALVALCADSYDWVCGGGRFEDDSQVEAVKEILTWE